jgi:predicted phage terminase large subunit-like protein
MPSADKLTRAKAVTPFFAAGNVLLPQGALWLAAYEGELLTFPVAESDDQVDMTSMALDHIFGATTTERTAADRAKDASILFS